MAIHDWAKYRSRWQDFHDRIIHELANIMIDEEQLPAGFDVVPTGRIYINRQIRPDTVITKQPPILHGVDSPTPTTDSKVILQFVATRPSILADKRLMVYDDSGVPVAVVELISPWNRTHREYYAIQYEEYLSHFLTVVMVDLIYFVNGNVHDIMVADWKDAVSISDNPDKKLFIAIYTPETEELTRTTILQFGFDNSFPEVILNIEGYSIPIPIEQAYQTTARRMKLPPA